MKDNVFLRGQRVPMTKEPVRLLALERLELASAAHFIDIGAGTGSVALEAAMRFPWLQVTAIERNPAALSLISENRLRLGCDNVTVMAGSAPMAWETKADAIFIGGSGGQLTALIDWALERLYPGGRLVFTFILLNNFSEALACLQTRDVAEISGEQVQFSTLTSLGSGHYFKPNNPTYLISCYKEGSDVSAH
ncbi:cobalt-precorrin 7 C15-methyltransferase [Serratia fonticola]|uniref:Cobalt-precorrin 7 C15-methyltransferase n=1 Tax=Serratia fonticola TaxID=47917 RepID=A0A542D443_SERFO|nr:decarboxylating cobalt-precorrin-6B (C(15))-methyltransferase [Serratia fonticola]TQI80148.1 cobalt-precorrin 7 C15-methyltransferase [Serratia fonticola]TQI97825.1 cobalt-precorrin 7 C15-methyltransferase [Serratia fonticola]TVZ72323.1 cobalt-precorrin 7 C15-methyltransferase [Serratia fonticola]